MMAAGGRAPLIDLQGVHKHYPLLNSGGQKLAALWALLRGAAVQAHYAALQSIDLQVRRGESLGIIGVNGAGKSTLLKIIAGVVKPTQGQVRVHGRIGALLELGAGFHPEYTGRQNLYLACAMMGMSRHQTDERLDDILAFADIGAHIDQPIKHYSSGMVVRLGFALTTVTRPDLLITDEVLAVGDESFQKKCIRWMEGYLDGGGTLLLCSHSMYHIQRMCKHAAWIHDGRVRQYGPADRVTQDYLAWHESQAVKPSFHASPTPSQGIYHVRQLAVNGQMKEAHLTMGDDLWVEGLVHSPDGRCPVVASSIVKSDGLPVFGTFSNLAPRPLQRIDDQTYAFRLWYPQVKLLPGSYVIRAHAMDPEAMRLMDQMEVALEVRGQTRWMGACALAHEWVQGPSNNAPGSERPLIR